MNNKWTTTVTLIETLAMLYWLLKYLRITGIGDLRLGLLNGFILLGIVTFIVGLNCFNDYVFELLKNKVT